ncbi:RloB family protein [Streptomyces violascens]|uniref:RloB family protein n=1 Tax=Streptomyces violascens TaxID=67381 RepID=UPI00365B1AD8
MARTRGRESVQRTKQPRGERAREVFVFTEGEVTEPEFVEWVVANGTHATQNHRVQHFIGNAQASGARRKPLPLVRDAVDKLDEVERAARKAGLSPESWNWPQVWCLFDRDQHQDIPTAFALARREGVHIAYSHPCFELWRLLHLQNYTSTFGGVCDNVVDRLKNHRKFVESYGATSSVSPEDAKRIRPGQLDDGYKKARQYAERINAQHRGPDQTRWDPYTDVWRFVEDGLGIVDY